MIWAPRERHADCLNACRERPLKQPDVARVAYAPESLSDVFERLACIVRQDARGHALGLTSLEDPGYRFLESRVRELTRNPHRQREIKMPHPDQVDARNGEDRVDILHAPSRFNQEAAQHAVVGCSRFVRHVSGEKVIVSDREGCAAASLGVVAAGFYHPGGVTSGLNSGNDDSPCSRVEDWTDEVRFAGGGSDQGGKTEGARLRGEIPDRLNPEAAVLHVIHNEVDAGAGQQTRDSGRVEFKNPRAEDHPALT